MTRAPCRIAQRIRPQESHQKIMFWQEEGAETSFEVPEDVVDVMFSIRCKRLPVDHAYALSRAIADSLPWIEEQSGIGVHAVHVAGSQNGWERPEHSTDRHLIVSRRTKLVIRVPKQCTDALRRGLTGVTLDVSGCTLQVGEGRIRPLSRETTLFSRYVVTRPDHDEDDFLESAATELRTLGIPVRKALCGKTTPVSTPAGALQTRSLMLAGLSPEESVRLQELGLGPHRVMGCGIFIPHKGIDSAKKGS
jgi:CRISPR-associated protein Cas6